MATHLTTLRNQLSLYLGLFIIGILITSWPALYNGFPLLYSDDGTYMWSGFDQALIPGRPMLYGLFISWASFRESLWHAYLLQSVICTFILLWTYWRFTENLTTRARTVYWLIFCAFLAWATSYAFVSNMLIPDVFVAMLFLLLMQLTYNRNSLWEAIIASLLIVFSIGVHNSHVIIASLFLLVIWIHTWITKNLAFDRLFRTTVVVILGIFSSPVLHASFAQGFHQTLGSYVFVIARIIEAGEFEQFLDEQCPEKEYVLCPYRNELGGDFLWDEEESPLYKIGGWEHTESKFKPIIKDYLMQPKWALNLLASVGKLWIQQLYLFRIEPLQIMDNHSAPYPPMKKFLQKDPTRMTSSKQGNENLHFKTLSYVEYIVVCISMLLLVFGWLTGQFNREEKKWILLLFLFVLINALVCSAFSIAIDRYQCRVIWLVPMILIILLINRVDNRRAEYS